MLTPADIQEKTFSTSLRGYDLDEVDDYLDEIVATIKELNEQLAEARSAAAKSPEPVADESAVGRALIAAQSAADQIMAAAREDSDRTLANAREEAERLVAEAQEQAEEFVAERDSKKAEAEAEMKMLSEHISNIRTQLALLATAVADKLDEMDALIAAESAGSGLAIETEDSDEEGTVAVDGAAHDTEDGQEESLFGEATAENERGEDEVPDYETADDEEADELP
jgi:cell division initiation protein